jgi:uncharacterized protein (TIGR02453 family)
MSSTTEAASFGPELFGFLSELRDHNDRDWFAANKARYEADVLEPALAFVEDMGYRLQEISPHLRADARRNGGSVFRIYRDTRFSKDKTPFKTNTGVHFRHARAKDVPAPGYYLHLQPGRVFAGCGIWHPDTKTANRIRDAIAGRAAIWRAATREPPFAGALEIGGREHALKRVPSSFDKEHEFADDLRLKGFVGYATMSEDVALAPDFLDRYTALCQAGAPLMRFLCDALGVEF